MSSRAKTENQASVNDTVIGDYLKQHPDFFQHNDELLDLLKIPHKTGAISLIERQVARLRQQKQAQEDQLKTLIHAARSNEQIINQVQRFTLEMILAKSMDDIFIICDDTLRTEFKADFTSVKLLSDNEAHDDPQRYIPSHSPLMRSFTQLFKNKKPLCGRITDKQRNIMFDNHADEVKSAVLVPLQNTKKLGVLALGSRDESRFHSGMGLLFLQHLGEIISTSIIRQSS